MKLTAPAFDKLLHSLWIWKTKLERMLVGHSRDNLHLCTYELKRVFRSKLFLLFLSWIRKYEEFIMIQFLEMICRIASCFFFCICMAKSEIHRYHNYKSYYLKTFHDFRTYLGHTFWNYGGVQDNLPEKRICVHQNFPVPVMTSNLFYDTDATVVYDFVLDCQFTIHPPTTMIDITNERELQYTYKYLFIHSVNSSVSMIWHNNFNLCYQGLIISYCIKTRIHK